MVRAGNLLLLGSEQRGKLMKLSIISINLTLILVESFVSNLENQATVSIMVFLQGLHLTSNGLKSLPSKIFEMCMQLSTLDLHNTEITMDTFLQLDGWQDFDDRSMQKKQLDF